MAILTDADGPGGYEFRCELQHRWLHIRIPWEPKKEAPLTPCPHLTLYQALQAWY